MERDMESVEYGHHEHPLIFHESKETPHCCSACGLRLLWSPYYSCVLEDCNFYIHPACKQLPDQLMLHHFHIDCYNQVEKKCLALFSKPRDDKCRCGDCGKLCKNFTYRCSGCEFVLHPLCASPLDIQIRHISHPQHPLLVTRKEACLLCDICGRKHEGYFFSCHQCDFWIHQDCVSLPTLVRVQNHHHHLSLFNSCADLSYHYVSDPKCLICGEMALTRFGVYHCLVCKLIAHLDCATSHNKDSGVVPHLPTMLNDTFPSLIMRAGVEELGIVEESESKGMLEKYHPHSLVLTDDTTAQESICNACIKPISPPYYHCNAPSHDCNFLLHKFCADLPLSINHQLYESRPARLASPRWDGFFSPFQCYRCTRYSNGFGYAYDAGDVDIDCALAPIIIKHDSHEQHPLLLINYLLALGQKRCCDEHSRYWYLCSVCKFAIHIDCARLPKTVTHKFDQHPLTLTFGASSNSSTDQYLCEICEEDMDPYYWFYHCTQCDQSFHVKCIPSTGKYSGVKFGGTIKVPCHAQHPMTLVRTIDVCSQTCGYCRKIIQGFEDGTALHCAHCDFWIHLDCGYASSGVTLDPNPSSRLNPFS